MTYHMPEVRIKDCRSHMPGLVLLFNYLYLLLLVEKVIFIKFNKNLLFFYIKYFFSHFIWAGFCCLPLSNVSSQKQTALDKKNDDTTFHMYILTQSLKAIYKHWLIRFQGILLGYVAANFFHLSNRMCETCLYNLFFFFIIPFELH